MPIPAAVHTRSLTLFCNETLKDHCSHKPGLSPLICIQAFLNTIYYFKCFSHLCILKFKEWVGRTAQKLPCQSVFEQEYLLLIRKTSLKSIALAARELSLYTKTLFWQTQTRACAVSKDILSPKNPCWWWWSYFHPCSSTQERNSSHFSFYWKKKMLFERQSQ